MNVETEKILLRQVIDTRKDVFVVEDNVIIPDVKPDILSIISSSSNLYVCKKEINNGKIKIDGGVELDTIYISDEQESKTRALHNSIDFTRNLDVENKIAEGDLFSCKLCTKSIEPKILNGRKINIQVTIEYEITIYSNSETQFIKSLGDSNQYQKISESLNICSFKNCGETMCSAKEKYTVPDGLSDIMQYNISIRNKEEKVSYNKVLSKADCFVNILYMAVDEQLKSAELQIPITGFIDMPGVSDNELIKSEYEIRNIEIKPDNTDNNAISIDIDFLVNCMTFENRSIDLIQDLYSPEEEISLHQETVILEQNRRKICDSFDASQNIMVPDAQDNQVYVGNVSVNNVSKKREKSSILFEGSALVDLIYKSSSTGRVEQKSESIDFSRTLNVDGLKEETIIDSNIEAYFKESRAVSVFDGTYEISTNVNLVIDLYEKISANLINDIKIEENVPIRSLSSLIIYFAKDGDTLWKIAKRFRTTIDEIAEINNMGDIEKLESGTQLFIPRHVSTKKY